MSQPLQLLHSLLGPRRPPLPKQNHQQPNSQAARIRKQTDPPTLCLASISSVPRLLILHQDQLVQQQRLAPPDLRDLTSNSQFYRYTLQQPDRRVLHSSTLALPRINQLLLLTHRPQQPRLPLVVSTTLSVVSTSPVRPLKSAPRNRTMRRRSRIWLVRYLRQLHVPTDQVSKQQAQEETSSIRNHRLAGHLHLNHQHLDLQ